MLAQNDEYLQEAARVIRIANEIELPCYASALPNLKHRIK